MTTRLLACCLVAACASTDPTSETDESVTITSATPVVTTFSETGPAQVGQVQTISITITNTTAMPTGQDVLNMHFPAAHFASFVEPAGIAPCNKDKDRNSPRGVVAGCVIPDLAPGASLTFDLSVIPDFAGTLPHTTDLFSPLGGAQTDLRVTIAPAPVVSGGGHGSGH